MFPLSVNPPSNLLNIMCTNRHGKDASKGLHGLLSLHAEALHLGPEGGMGVQGGQRGPRVGSHAGGSAIRD
eukprot:5528708-Pyramimonas_sp.AAC.1